MIATEPKTAEHLTISERDVALSSYYSVLQSVWGIITAANEPIAVHIGTIEQLPLLFKEGHMAKAESSSPGLSE